MGDGVDLIADNVVEAIGDVRVDKAVANPLTSSDAISLLVTLVKSIPSGIQTYLSLISHTTSKASSAPSSSNVPA